MADYSDSFDPAHEQEQELLVVQSIFMDEFKRLPDEPASGGHGICKVVQLTILPCPNEPDANHCDARLLVRLEPSYPIQPPLLTVQAGDLSQSSEAVLAGLRQLLKAKVAELAGHAQLMALAEAASEFLRAHNEPPKPQGPSFHEQMVQRQRQQRQASGEDELGEEGLTERAVEEASDAPRLAEVEAELEQQARTGHPPHRNPNHNHNRNYNPNPNPNPNPNRNPSRNSNRDPSPNPNLNPKLYADPHPEQARIGQQRRAAAAKKKGGRKKGGKYRPVRPHARAGDGSDDGEAGEHAAPKLKAPGPPSPPQPPSPGRRSPVVPPAAAAAAEPPKLPTRQRSGGGGDGGGGGGGGLGASLRKLGSSFSKGVATLQEVVRRQSGGGSGGGGARASMGDSMDGEDGGEEDTDTSLRLQNRFEGLDMQQEVQQALEGPAGGRPALRPKAASRPRTRTPHLHSPPLPLTTNSRPDANPNPSPHGHPHRHLTKAGERGHSRFHNDFAIVEKLGAGGFGRVWRARNRLDGVEYAVKAIKILPGDNVTKLLREVNTLSRMHHENIVRYYQARGALHLTGLREPVYPMLQPYASQAATECIPGCNRMYPRRGSTRSRSSAPPPRIKAPSSQPPLARRPAAAAAQSAVRSRQCLGLARSRAPSRGCCRPLRPSGRAATISRTTSSSGLAAGRATRATVTGGPTGAGRQARAVARAAPRRRRRRGRARRRRRKTRRTRTRTRTERAVNEKP